MKNIDNNKIHLYDLFNGYNVQGSVNLKDIFGEKCPIQKIENFVNRNYCKAVVEHKNGLKEIHFGKDLTFVKIKDGIFKDGILVIESGREYFEKTTDLTAITNDSFFRYPRIKGTLDNEELDFLLTTNGICETLSNEFATFNISKSYQFYEFLCSDLPKRFWQTPNIKENLLKSIDRKEINFVNVIDKDFINEKKVREKAKNTVLSFVARNSEIESEIER